ncbi:C39 family peptidase [Phycisphaera mikurensis]|uniref:Peptidase C39 domain-containing protein n=1 Tax=Phycisphaera mikurensis (strain NBRC 102666 / KCTC 22515 / FYK2301M01) TaxID=1142394 RepID=I0ICX9_PHYMF|nr:cysteine peptidase family C39 domain-containing protein [Phycisphaera mikurensis]MBB6442247.1 hypothetical protein [Phycisphaera mikurensis]BAM03117.1 hypothetical protein PSMK_09580 [Phycisphaera mikurensis NBRC 102666]
MDDFCWFGIAVMVSVAGWMLGRRAGSAGDRTARLAAILGVVLLIAWTWLLRHPAVGVRLVPVSLLARVEGTGSVPMFALILGVCWERARVARQRAVVGWAVALGIVYLANGGGWLLQQTPDAVMGRSTRATGSEALVMQSQDFSCVPAACATLLRRWGEPASEANMARLTRTRAGSGSTMLRALEGLSERLAGADLRPVLLQVDYADLVRLPMPLITPLQNEASRRHMVAIDRRVAAGYVLLDPIDGVYWIGDDQLASSFIGQVIVLEERR